MDKLEVEGALGAKLAARIDRPSSETRAVALFAHCFTCGKDIFAARTIARRLAERGIATVRFDFTGLGSSEGEFASTYFSSNVGDLVKMADAMRDGIGAPTLLVGHSLGGAAVLAAAGRIPKVRAVATIGAPADVAHVAEQFSADLARIEAEGAAEVSLAGRTFTIRREFVDDLRAQALEADVASLRAALLVMHAPRDEVVGIDNATRIFLSAKHPKSFVSLDDADHLLSARRHADYAADVIAAWASRYVAAGAPADQEGAPAVLPSEHDGVRATDAGGRFRTDLAVGNHRLRADEPEDVGGNASGPTPYDLVAAGLAACTVMTMRLYAEGKGWTVEATVDVAHGKVHARDCEDCADAAPGSDGRIDRFERRIRFAPGTSPAERDKLLEIADKCPVHRSLERGAAVVTRTVD